MTIPLYQPFVKVERSLPLKLHNQICNLQQVMRSKASEGVLLIEANELGYLSQTDLGFLMQCEQFGILHNTERMFGGRKLVFYSLKLEVISLESVIWALRSLKNDEMTPNEKAIQSRIKEAFSYKVNSRLWDKIMEGIKTHCKSETGQHNHAGSNPQGCSFFKMHSKNTRYHNLHCSNDFDSEKIKCYGPLTSTNSRNQQMVKGGGSFHKTNSLRKYTTTRSGKKLYSLGTEFEIEIIAFELEEDTPIID